MSNNLFTYKYEQHTVGGNRSFDTTCWDIRSSDTTCWNHNLVLCELMNSTNNYNQLLKYQSHTRTQKFTWKTLSPWREKPREKLWINSLLWNSFTMFFSSLCLNLRYSSNTIIYSLSKLILNKFSRRNPMCMSVILLCINTSVTNSFWFVH